MSEKSECLLDYITKKVNIKLSGYYIALFFVSFFTCMIVHAYGFTHKFINHDDVMGLYTDASFGMSYGRFLLEFMTKLNGSFSASWLNGIIGSLFLSITVLLIINLFDIRHYITAISIVLTIIAFPVVVSTYAYMFCSYQYLFAVMMSALGAYLIRKEKFVYMVIGSLCIALGMGCYQAYYCFAATLLLFVLCLDLLKNRWDGNFISGFSVGFRYLTALAFAMMFYFIILKVCLIYTGTELISYKGINKMGLINLETLFHRIRAAYNEFFGFYREFFLIGSLFVFFIFFLFFNHCVFCYKLYKHKISLVLILILIFLLPLACNLVYVMSEPEDVHMIMRFPMVVPIIIPSVIADRIKVPLGLRDKKCVKLFYSVAVCFILFVQILFGYIFLRITNHAYFCMDMTYKNVYAYYTKLTVKIEMQDKYSRETPIALVGNASMVDFVPKTIDCIPKMSLTGVLSGFEALNMYSRQYFFKYFLGCDYKYADDDLCVYIQNLPEFRSMPNYPDSGSIRTICNVIVVKLSDDDYLHR